MNKLREAAKLALEALEHLHRTGDTQVFDHCYAGKVIPALRAALSETVENHFGDANKMVEKCQWPECDSGMGCENQCPDYPEPQGELLPSEGIYEQWITATKPERTTAEMGIPFARNLEAKRETDVQSVFTAYTNSLPDYERGFVEGAQHQMESAVHKAVTAMSERREWVGLTDEELKPVCDESYIMYGDYAVVFARAIEAKLKEKNS